MDRPLLALTRAGLYSPETIAAQNMLQLVQLRWIAVAGQTIAILLVHYGLRVPLPLIEMLSVALLLGVANLAVMMAVPRHNVLPAEVIVTLLLDMGALTLQLYFSGGATNPFISLYLLQVVLGAILLRPIPAAALMLVAALCYALLSVRFVPLALGNHIAGISDVFALGRWVAFAMVASLLVLFITRISRNLRARDAHVADLRQHAAEEEGIVRMGLFASGAAHELGTPLGTLSVILSDWRRVPEIAVSPQLAAEVGEMQAEVQRCKHIVSDILHSAGQPRGEAMESVAAAPFVEETARDWQPTHPHVPLDVVVDFASAVVAADPALRQAIWNLLDNAAEASPEGVQLQTAIENAMLVIAVNDWCPGFAPDTLTNAGQLYRSTKGVGHGLGLFLATTVARRLGGRLEVRNRASGGAQVRMHLPLVERASR